MAAPVVLVEAAPRRAVDATAVPVRLAGGGAIVPYDYGGQHYRAGLAGLPRSIASLNFDGEQLGGGGTAQALELRWSPSTAAALAELADLYWGDAPITVRVGPEGPDMPPVAQSGLVLDAAADDGALRIAMADGIVDLRRPVLVDRFAGTGGLEGPVEWEGLIRSRAWGRCFNVPGRMILPGSNIACFGDPRRRWQAFDQVRVRGVAIETLTVLAWQGSAEATWAALVAIAVPAGTAVACPSIACVKWWTDPAGDLHADILGEIDAGYVETAPAIAARIIAARSTLTVNTASLNAAITARPAACGWRVDSEGATAAGELSELLGGVSLSWLVADDQIVFRQWKWAAPTRVARSEGVSRRQIYKPVASRKLGYRRNWAPMARGDLAAIVLARDVVYDDGTSIGDAIASLDEQVREILSDDVITRGREKRDLVDRWDALEAKFLALDARHVGLGSPAGIQPARDEAYNRYRALATALAALQPAWDDIEADTPIDGQALGAVWKTARQKIEIFAAAITGQKGEPGENAPLVLTQWSVDGASGWHTDFAEGDLYQRQSNDNGATWGPAIRVVGEAGESTVGADGSSPSIIFRRSATVPATPAINTSNPPPGWSDGPPGGTGILWQSVSRFRGATQLQAWSPPVRITGDKGDPGANAPLVRTQWSVDGAGGWHDAYAGGDLYQRQSPDAGVTWGPAVRVVGESASSGTDGVSPSIVFRRSATVPAKPAQDTGNPPPGWSDAPPAGADLLWQSVSRFRGVAQLEAWSAPVRITGPAGATISAEPAAFILRVAGDGSLVSGQTLPIAIARVGMPGTTQFAILNVDGNVVGVGPAAQYASGQPTYYQSSGPDRLTLTPLGLAVVMGDHGGAAGRFTIRAFVDGFAPTASVTVQRLADGADSDVPGPPGRDAVVFQQDAAPVHPVVGDTWVTVIAPKVWRKWDGTSWVQILGDVSALDIITEAYIADLSVGSAKIKDLSVTSLKIGDQAISAGKLGHSAVQQLAFRTLPYDVYVPRGAYHPVVPGPGPNDPGEPYDPYDPRFPQA